MKKVITGILVCSLSLSIAVPNTALATNETLPGAGIYADTSAATTTSGEGETQAETTAAETTAESVAATTESTEALPSAGISFTNLLESGDGEEEHPAIVALEARLAGTSVLYKDIAITTVENYVNIRTKASSDSDVVGKIYNNSGAYIDDTVENSEGTWYQIHSGTCKGYVLAKYFLTGKDAADIASTVSTMYATVNTESLRLRAKASLEAETVSVLSANEKYVVIGEEGDFVKLQLDDDLTGYVLKDYVKLSVSFKQAISIEEEQAELARQAEIARQRREAEEKAKQESIEASKEASREAAEKKKSSSTKKKSSSSSSTKKKSSSSSSSSTKKKSSKKSTKAAGSSAGSVSSKREALCSYAESFVGELSYVRGGNSLKSGTDCSGFVHLVFEKYGVDVARQSTELRSSGERISSSEMRPGDIVCYSGHVAIYIGNDTVVHCSSRHSNPNTKYSTWNYRSVVCIVNPWGD